MDLSLLGKRIRAERKLRSMTLESLSERVGISRNFLWEIEAGRKAPALNTLYNLGDTLNVSIDYLIGLTEERRCINQSIPTEDEVRISEIVRMLHGCDNRELMLISEIIDVLSNYFNEK